MDKPRPLFPEPFQKTFWFLENGRCTTDLDVAVWPSFTTLVAEISPRLEQAPINTLSTVPIPPDWDVLSQSARRSGVSEDDDSFIVGNMSPGVGVPVAVEGADIRSVHDLSNGKKSDDRADD